MAKTISLATAACLPLVAFAAADALAAGATETGSAPPPGRTEPQKPAMPMDMNAPMTTGMMKPGMTMGDVRKAAEKRAKELQPLMEQEEKSMPSAEKAKP